MNKLRNLILVMAVLFFANSCAEPEDPTPTQILYGEWRVENVIANGQVNIPGIFNVNAKLHLDRNGTFLFVNIDGRGDAGTWTATETSLTLTGGEGANSYTIAFLDWNKLHVHRTFTIAQGGEVELRYMFRRD